jgi:glutamine amidotransferase
MCRLYGQRSRTSASAAEPLCSSHNALRFQSHAHPHGWGVGWWEGGRPRVERGLLPAHADQAFCDASHRAHSQVVLAHVRDASVGPVTAANTHPFTQGPWVFAHNGTVARYKRSSRLRARLEEEIAPALRPLLQGDTDSERCFLLFLTRVQALRAEARPALDQVRRALAETTALVAALADAGAARPSSLNFLVSDGRLLLGTRRGRSLHWLQETGPKARLVIASEPIGSGKWVEVPEGGYVGVGPGLRAVAGMLE